MKTIGILTVAFTLLSCATITSSVGGPLTELLILVLAVWAVGVHKAWSKRVSLFGWIASIVLSIIGGAVGIAVSNVVMEMVLSLSHFEGSLAKSNHPLFYVMSSVMAIITVLGAWSAIQILDLIPHRNGGVRRDA